MARSWNTVAQKAESMNSRVLTRVTGTPTRFAAGCEGPAEHDARQVALLVLTACLCERNPSQKT